MRSGDILAGRYVLQQARERGRGTVWFAHDRDTDQPVALKCFDTSRLQSDELQRYRVQLVAAAAVVGPAVVRRCCGCWQSGESP